MDKKIVRARAFRKPFSFWNDWEAIPIVPKHGCLKSPEQNHHQYAWLFLALVPWWSRQPQAVFRVKLECSGGWGKQEDKATGA